MLKCSRLRQSITRIDPGKGDCCEKQQVGYIFLSEMKSHGLKGTYKVITADLIEWMIQDNVRIEILLHASDVGLHDVLVIFFSDPDGKEHRTPWGDDYPHDHIMEILQDYNAKDFKVKKGLFGWKLVEK